MPAKKVTKEFIVIISSWGEIEGQRCSSVREVEDRIDEFMDESDISQDDIFVFDMSDAIPFEKGRTVLNLCLKGK